MKRDIKNIVSVLIVTAGIFYIISDWPVYKEIFNRIITSDLERSLEVYNSKIKYDPNNAWNYVYRGATYKKHKLYNEALQDYLKAYELNHSFMWLNDISNTYLALGNTEKAHHYIFKKMSEGPGFEHDFFDLAIIYDYEWKSKQACSAYTKFISLVDETKSKEKYLFALKRRAIHYMLLKNSNQAKNDISVLLTNRPDDKEAKVLENIINSTDNTNIKEAFPLDVYNTITGNYFQ